MEERRERRAFAAGCDIARPEICNHGAARALGDQRGIADLERRPQFGVMRDGLPVRADRVDRAERHARGIGCAPRRRREALSDRDVERGELAQRFGARHATGSEAMNARLKLRLVGRLDVREQPKRPRSGVIRPFDQRGVDAIRRSPGHQPNYSHVAQNDKTAARAR